MRMLPTAQRSAVRLLSLSALLAVAFADEGDGIDVAAGPGAHPTSKVSENPITAVTQHTGFQGLTFTMALHEEHPFVFVDSTKTGNARFSGVTVDVANRLCEKLDCKLDFLLASSTNPQSAEEALLAIGAGTPVGTTHMADIAGGAIHITPNRSNYVHFTLPYYDTGYIAVVPRPAEKAYDPWAFLKPFKEDLWGCLFLEILIVGVVFAWMESPSSSVSEESDIVDGSPTVVFFDTLYLSLSALTCTLDKAPKTWGGKLTMLAHGWFMLIIIASYTANLATFLTTSALSPSITGWPDVTSSASTVKLAIPSGLAHGDFLAFEQSHYNYQFNVAQRTPTWEDSMQAVIDGTADVTFHDEAMVQYYMLNTMPTTPKCPLMMVGSSFNPTGYGFAFGHDSTAFLAWSQAILTLKENGEISKILGSYGVGDAKATAAINKKCSLSSSASMKSSEFHGLFISTGVIVGVALIVNAVNKHMNSKDGTDSESVPAQIGGPGVHDPNFENALRAALQTALKESMDASFNAGLAAGLRESQKYSPSVPGGSSVQIQIGKESIIGGAVYTGGAAPVYMVQQ